MLHTHRRSSWQIVLQPRLSGQVDHLVHPVLYQACTVCRTSFLLRSCIVASFVPVACDRVDLKWHTQKIELPALLHKCPVICQLRLGSRGRHRHDASAFVLLRASLLLCCALKMCPKKSRILPKKHILVECLVHLCLDQQFVECIHSFQNEQQPWGPCNRWSMW